MASMRRQLFTFCPHTRTHTHTILYHILWVCMEYLLHSPLTPPPDPSHSSPYEWPPYRLACMESIHTHNSPTLTWLVQVRVMAAPCCLTVKPRIDIVQSMKTQLLTALFRAWKQRCRCESRCRRMDKERPSWCVEEYVTAWIHVVCNRPQFILAWSILFSKNLALSTSQRILHWYLRPPSKQTASQAMVATQIGAKTFRKLRDVESARYF